MEMIEPSKSIWSLVTVKGPQCVTACGQKLGLDTCFIWNYTEVGSSPMTAGGASKEDCLRRSFKLIRNRNNYTK